MRMLAPKKSSQENENRISIGSIVEYEQHAAAIVAVVTAEKKDKWTVLNSSGGSLDLPATRLYLLPGRIPEEEKTVEKKASYLSRILREANEMGSRIQLEELWNLFYGEKSEISIPEIADLLFQENALVSHLAVRRTMLADSIFFKRLKNTFEPRTPEVVAELKTKAQVEAAKRAYREALTGALLKRIQGQDVPLPESIRIIEQYAALGKSAETSKEAQEVIEEVIERGKLSITQKAHDRAFAILVRARHFTEDQNLALIRLGREVAFSAEVEEFARNVSKNALNETSPPRKDLRHLPLYAIDSATTTDVDDALSIEVLEDGFRVGIHISDVASSIPPGSILEREAYGRATSIYCADAHIPMLPSVLSENAVSLHEGVDRPAVSFFIEFSKDFEIRNRDLCQSIVCVKKRLTYEEVDQVLFEKRSQPSEQDQILLSLWDATCVCEARRLQMGALQFSRREMQVKILPDGKLELEDGNEDTPAHKLVSEMMILANESAALFGVSRGIPLVFRSQEPPDVDPEAQGSDIPEGPARDYFKRSFLKRSVTSPTPGVHYGLGLQAYIQATSPIRRAMDLINQRQLITFLQTGKPFYTEPEVLETLSSLEVGLDEAWQIQRERNRYYLLRYLKQEKFQDIEALIIKVDGPKPLAELEQVYLLNPFHVAGDKDQETLKKRRGTKVRLKIESLDPRADVLVLRESN